MNFPSWHFDVGMCLKSMLWIDGWMDSDNNKHWITHLAPLGFPLKPRKVSSSNPLQATIFHHVKSVELSFWPSVCVWSQFSTFLFELAISVAKSKKIPFCPFNFMYGIVGNSLIITKFGMLLETSGVFFNAKFHFYLICKVMYNHITTQISPILDL